MQSEAVLVTLLAKGHYKAWLLLVVASVGNVLGSCVNFWLGRQIDRFYDKPWFPVSAVKLAKAKRVYQKYGFWSLLFSWTPVIGDPITLIAGLMKENFWRFLFIVCIAKGGRYAVLYWVYLGVV